MPIFEYQCQNCGAKTEKIRRQAVSEIPCAYCGGKAIRCVSSVAAGQSRCSAPSSSGFT